MLRLRLLGNLSVTLLDGRSPAPMAMQPRRLAMLAYIGRSGERGVARDRLATLFWPDADDEAARRGVSQALYALRTGLDAPELFDGVQEVRLSAAVATCDLVDFEAALAARDLDAAARAYSGPFLDGFRLPNAPEFEQWVEETRGELTHKHEVLLERLARRAAERQEWPAAVGWWRRRVAGDPLNARTCVEYMRALAACGDVPGALAHARVYESLMTQRLELPPDPLVLALVDTLRRDAKQHQDVPAIAAAAPLPTVASPTAVATTSLPPQDGAEPGVVADPVPLALPAVPSASPRLRRRRTPWLITVAGLAAAATAMALAQPESTLLLDDPTRLTTESSIELDAAINPDGKQVAYAAGMPGRMRILVQQQAGARPIAVIDDSTGDQRRPRWSPDGQQLLFQWKRGIWMVPALGGLPREIVAAPADSMISARYPAWSPDGTQIAWIQRNALLVRDLRGGEPRVLARDRELHSPTWSPDGQRIALLRGNEAFLYGTALEPFAAGIPIGNLAPSSVVTVTAACATKTAPCPVVELLPATSLHSSVEWLSDRTLVVVSNRGGTRDLFRVHMDARGQLSGSLERLSSGLDIASVSVAAPNRQSEERRIAFSVYRQSSNIWSVPITANRAIPVRDAMRVTSGAQSIEGMDVSIDEQQLAFDANRDGQQDIFVLGLRDGRPIGAEAVRVTDAPADDFHPAFSPDGATLAFYSIRDGVRRGAVVPTRGGATTLLHPQVSAREEHSPVWRPDGKGVVYFRQVRDTVQLFESRRTAAGVWEPERLLTQRGGYAVSTGGQERLVYNRGPGEIWQMPFDTTDTEARRLYPGRDGETFGLKVWGGRITPDGQTLIVRGSDSVGNGFWAMPISGGTPRLVLRLDDPERPTIRGEFACSGRHLFFTRAEQQADIWTGVLRAR